MIDELEDFWVHTVTVETYMGNTAWGQKYEQKSPPIPCFVSDKRRLIRTPSGDTEVSESTVTANRKYAPLFAEGSIVHLPGRTAVVLKLADNSSSNLELPDHMQASLS